MKTGPYDYVNIRTFEGREGLGLECGICKNGMKFATYCDYGDGGEGYLRPLPDDESGTAKMNRMLTREFEKFARDNVPPFEDGLPGNLDYFMEIVHQWAHCETNAAAAFSKYPGVGCAIAFCDGDGLPVSLLMLPETTREAAFSKVRSWLDEGRLKTTDEEKKIFFIARGERVVCDILPVLEAI